MIKSDGTIDSTGYTPAKVVVSYIYATFLSWLAPCKKLRHYSILSRDIKWSNNPAILTE